MSTEHVRADLAIIGCGLAGVAAAVSASRRGLDAVLLGSTGGIVFTSGYLDVFGLLPGTQEVFGDPWQGLRGMAAANPKHPYARMASSDVRAAMEQFVAFLGDAGLDYVHGGDRNLSALSPAGTFKPTWAMPATMAKGPDILASDAACVIVGIEGLKGFSAKQVAANCCGPQRGIRAAQVPFPGLEGYDEVFAEHVARALEVPANREAFAEVLRPHCEGVQALGLPAILGIHAPGEVLAALEALLGVTVFEIPSMPPSLAGIRLREAFEESMPRLGVRLLARKDALSVTQVPDGLEIMAGARTPEVRVTATGAVLATGRFLGGGLRALRTGVEETVLGVPVTQPPTRSDWHRLEYFDPGGHDINAVGVEVDGNMRVIGADGRPYHPRMYAAGSILAHQDWVRTRSGAGLAVATADRAVASFAEQVG